MGLAENRIVSAKTAGDADTFATNDRFPNGKYVAAIRFVRSLGQAAPREDGPAIRRSERGRRRRSDGAPGDRSAQAT